MSRAMLTGALVGAQVGLEGIPRRFITGLRDAQRYLMLAAELEQLAGGRVGMSIRPKSTKRAKILDIRK